MTKYRDWYDRICNRGRSRKASPGCERHHILPRAFGGSDDESNIASLTYREHFLVHWLLTKITVGEDQRKMRYALLMMTRGGNRVVSGWQYAVAKTASANARLGSKHSEEVRQRCGNINKGRRLSTEHRAKISISGKGKRHSEASKALMSKNRRGIGHSIEARAKISAVRKGRKLGPVPEAIRQKRAAGIRAAWARRKAASQVLS